MHRAQVPAAPSQPIACKYRDPSLLHESRNCNCNCNMFNICNFCNISRDLHLQHLRYLQQFWQINAYMQGALAQNVLLQLPQLQKLPPFVPICPSGVDDFSDNSDISLPISGTDTDDTDDICDQSQILKNRPILILIILIVARRIEHSVWLKAISYHLKTNY